MLLILAHPHDIAARALADRWGSAALLLTGADLRRARWCLEVDRDGRARTALASADGTPLSVAGVVNRLGSITVGDLPGVHPEDRQYAAVEFTAFLTAWLAACPVPVLNPPTPMALNGPAWHPEQWVAAATTVGLRADVVRRLGLTEPAAIDPVWDGAVSAHVVGDTCLGDAHPEVGRRLCALARLVGTPLLTAAVSGREPDARVRDISVWPDLAVPEVADALAAAVAG